MAETSRVYFDDAVKVIEFMSRRLHGVTVVNVQDYCDLTYNKAERILKNIVAAGWAYHNEPTKSYRLSPELGRIGLQLFQNEIGESIARLKVAQEIAEPLAVLHEMVIDTTNYFITNHTLEA